MEPGTWNLYTYCANDPVNYTDPSGHRSFDVAKGTKYAKRHATKRNPLFKSCDHDCTNFASQILLAGGVQQDKTWWSVGKAKASKAWLLADKFVKQWGTYKIFKRKKNQKTTQLYRMTKKAQKGDFIAYDRTGDGSWDHVGYVSNKSGKKRIVKGRKVYNLEITQHTRDYSAWLTNVGTDGQKNGWVPHYKENYKKIRYAIVKRI